ncbi:hypothetical protein [Brevundimonas sp. UBA5866]|uniref:hypothetical protein n=1 Tax=Brevundimonas sp. UBA5866 TaxID=1946132 RepID=UPI0025BC00F0|nr:hypothetical protein [Brevundimonas sp. UBA5866]
MERSRDLEFRRYGQRIAVQTVVTGDRPCTGQRAVTWPVHLTHLPFNATAASATVQERTMSITLYGIKACEQLVTVVALNF